MEYVDYLVLGTFTHGAAEVWEGPKESGFLQLPTDKQPLAKLYGHNTPAEVITRATEAYQITEYSYDGHIYLVASKSPLSDFDVDAEIKKLLPTGLKPLR